MLGWHMAWGMAFTGSMLTLRAYRIWQSPVGWASGVCLPWRRSDDFWLHVRALGLFRKLTIKGLALLGRSQHPGSAFSVSWSRTHFKKEACVILILGENCRVLPAANSIWCRKLFLLAQGTLRPTHKWYVRHSGCSLQMTSGKCKMVWILVKSMIFATLACSARHMEMLQLSAIN